MKNLKVATAQFENQSGDKAYNLKVIDGICRDAAAKGAEIVAFHECSVTGYTFAKDLTKNELLELLEYIPEGASVIELSAIAARHGVLVCAGLFERGADGNIFKAYVCVDANGLVAKYRKLHPFIHPDIMPGDGYCVFEWQGWKIGILICYDNNIIENVRATKLLGADIILMPHVTMCTPSTRPGAGFVDPKLWQNRENDPTTLREEFEGLKGRKWLMKWLPARAYDNAVYCVFANAVGMDGGQLKNGHSMIIDPFGDILAECTALGDEFVIATLQYDKIALAGGTRYLKARRPELYRDIIGQTHRSDQQVSWLAGQNAE
ncbi:nitrilase family protein [Mucilaginibacter pedocola]|uniref:Nitrilase n=1 Tax=Mucilaginibacter pedocola TaxID=1792845 RepID=A0A1S9P6G2_9SPHI|nr:nitrilase family protein [Mucilaginibacter pedocola]OOQ56544.1 nitrilase [Mucilaginibacter pedocola]